MAKLKALGRGLDALLGEDRPQAIRSERQTELSVDLLGPGKYQPRTHLDESALQELASSVKAQGVMQPILVRPIENGRYEIIAGERRWRAARLAGLAAVPVVVRDVDDNAALVMALVENIQREDLDPIEQASGIQRLIAEFKMTHDQAAEMVGRSRSAVSNLLRLLALAAPVRELVQQGRLDMGHARALLALSGMQQIDTARLIAERGLSVREAERMVGKLVKGMGTARGRRTTDRDTLRLEEELSQRLGTRVNIKPAAKKGSGKLIINYRTLDQLDAILARL